mmetsp:Transcript_44643/g.136177  ORF Transcript_44643/g.136177 Transcript_44643/m.136177 type:complete len:101 (-) Transcript_44643:120-422(-)
MTVAEDKASCPTSSSANVTAEDTTTFIISMEEPTEFIGGGRRQERFDCNEQWILPPVSCTFVSCRKVCSHCSPRDYIGLRVDATGIERAVRAGGGAPPSR